MTHRITTLIGAAAVVASVLAAHSQSQSQPQQPRPPAPAPTADPYVNNPNPGASGFPLAAPAGADSRARETPPAGAVNQGRFDPATWKYGTAFDPPKGAQVWNPVRIKMQQGGKVTGATLFGSTDPSVYCAMANAGYDFIWTEMQHDQRDWQATARLWRTCAQAKAVPGVRIAYTDEREIQHALDAGALVLVVPTVDTVEEAREVVEWAYFPPMGRRSNGGGQAFDAAMWGAVPGGYRNTINDNLVVILMIETLEGLKNAEAIAKVPGVTGDLRRQRRPGQLHRLPPGRSRLRAGDQHRARRRAGRRRAAVRALRLARPARLHLLPERERDGADRPRRGGGAGRAGQHSGQADRRPLRVAALGGAERCGSPAELKLRPTSSQS